MRNLIFQTIQSKCKKWYNIIHNPKEGELNMLDVISQSLVNMTSKFGKGDLDKGVVFDTQTGKFAVNRNAELGFLRVESGLFSMR